VRFGGVVCLMGTTMCSRLPMAMGNRVAAGIV
jgi:hypothetical protein